MLLWVVDCDKKVAGLCGGIGVPGVCFQVVVQLQPVEQRGRGGGTRCVNRRAIGEPHFLRGQIYDTTVTSNLDAATGKNRKQRADRLILTVMQLFLSVNGALVEAAAACNTLHHLTQHLYSCLSN